MVAMKQTQKFLLALACCLALVVAVPLSVGAQNVIEKGAQGVQKGVETGADKTKEGADAVGRGVKDTFGNDDNQQTTTESQSTTETRQKPSQSTTTTESTTQPSTSESQTKSTTSKSHTQATTTEKGEKGQQLPRTAGELPLLALIGGAALMASGTLKLLRRTS
jgi:cobalamin biosynthesis Mg chelatase CobN